MECNTFWISSLMACMDWKFFLLQVLPIWIIFLGGVIGVIDRDCVLESIYGFNTRRNDTHGSTSPWTKDEHYILSKLSLQGNLSFLVVIIYYFLACFPMNSCKIYHSSWDVHFIFYGSSHGYMDWKYESLNLHSKFLCNASKQLLVWNYDWVNH